MTARDEAEWFHYGAEGLYREGEEDIARHEYWAYYYTRDVIKGRFKLGEKAIKKNELYWYWYVEYLKKKGIEI